MPGRPCTGWGCVSPVSPAVAAGAGGAWPCPSASLHPESQAVVGRSRQQSPHPAPALSGQGAGEEQSECHPRAEGGLWSHEATGLRTVDTLTLQCGSTKVPDYRLAGISPMTAETDPASLFDGIFASGEVVSVPRGLRYHIRFLITGPVPVTCHLSCHWSLALMRWPAEGLASGTGLCLWVTTLSSPPTRSPALH